METKICKKCGIEKQYFEYSIKKVNGKEYLYSYCRECEKENVKEYRIKNHDLILKKAKIYREKNHDLVLQRTKKWRENNAIYRKEYRKKQYQKNRETEIKQARQYQENHKEEIKQKHKEYIKRNKEKIKEYNKKWEFENKEYRNKYSNNLRKEKSKNNKVYKLKLNIRPMIYNSFKRNKQIKKGKSEKILGCDIDFFIKYLLKTFKNNYGYEWDGIEKVHIDHIKPLSIAKTEEEVIELCHYSNLQLLKAKDNLMKHNKLNWELLK